jgi:tetratricopeptide (TPR) repeat protein
MQCFFRNYLGRFGLVILFACIGSSLADDKPASVSLHKYGALITFRDTLPFALFQWKDRTWIALPTGTLPKTLPSNNKYVQLRKVSADGGDVLTVATNDNIFPALRRHNGSVEIVLMKKPKNIDLNPQFLDNRILKRQNRHNVEINFSLKNRVILTEAGNNNPIFILMTPRYYTGVRALTPYPEFSLQPTLQGVFIVGHRPDLTFTSKGLALPAGFQPWKQAQSTSKNAFTFSRILSHDPHVHDLANKARKALLSGHIDAARNAINTFQKTHTQLNDNPDFNALKGLILAFDGCSSGAMACFGTTPELWHAAQMFCGVLYMKSGHYAEGIDCLDRYFSKIKRLPDPLQKSMLFLGAEGALLLGKQKKAAFFLSTLKTKQLSSEQQSLLSILENSSLTDHTFIERQISGASAANVAWQTYHIQVRKKLHTILLRYETKVANLSQTLLALEKLSQEGRGGVVEFEVLEKLASLYEGAQDYAHAIKAYAKLIRYAPEDDPKKPLFRKRASDIYIKALYTEEWPVLKRCGFFKQYRSFLPQDDRGEEVLSTFTMMFLDKGFVDHIVPIIFKTLSDDPQKRAQLLLACVKVYLNTQRPTEALLVLNKNKTWPKPYQESWALHKAWALSLLDKNQQALELLYDVPLSPEKADIELKIYNALGDRERALNALRYLVETTRNLEYVDQMGVDLYRSGNIQAIVPFLQSHNIPVTPFVNLLLSKTPNALPKTLEDLKNQLKSYDEFKRVAAQVS